MNAQWFPQFIDELEKIGDAKAALGTAARWLRPDINNRRELAGAIVGGMGGARGHQSIDEAVLGGVTGAIVGAKGSRYGGAMGRHGGGLISSEIGTPSGTSGDVGEILGGMAGSRAGSRLGQRVGQAWHRAKHGSNDSSQSAVFKAAAMMEAGSRDNRSPFEGGTQYPTESSKMPANQSLKETQGIGRAKLWKPVDSSIKSQTIKMPGSSSMPTIGSPAEQLQE